MESLKSPSGQASANSQNIVYLPVQQETSEQILKIEKRSSNHKSGKSRGPADYIAEVERTMELSSPREGFRHRTSVKQRNHINSTSKVEAQNNSVISKSSMQEA
jgi:hypothetical protein